ncbi:hypothetical protein GCM10010885_19820 [Alicyclobacillus cellulosilyticus]|uniref:Uncharacterized protein n=1 Tax=Alicyclobacillus cellulosilyticus TaxID=1003997 RepID=A0A917KE38_9BACL|nr:hypothetical protein [Alicyclobacillus cellulosilyticus]GGJ10647.1 hypothetical protein GCM10010885_19820 [Alicyclobacillus cellulosilyticus]
MASVIALGVVNTNVAQQNAGVFIGEIHITGWDANGKTNQGNGSIYGWFNVSAVCWNANADGMEWVDGLIVDPDVKPSWTVQW